MRRSSTSLSLLLGLVLSLPLIAILFLLSRLGLAPFVPFSLFDLVSRILPGHLITAVIDIMVRIIRLLGLGPTDVIAKAIERGMAIGMFAVAVSVATLAVTLVLGIGAQQLKNIFAKVTVVALLIAGVATFVGRTMPTAPTAFGADLPLNVAKPATEASSIVLAARPVQDRTGIMPAPGTRPEITPNEKFYRIDINTIPPMINGKTWKLAATGLFAKPRELTLSDIMQLPEATQALTLSCISNPVGGDLIGTGFFTGVRLKDLLESLGIMKDAKSLRVKAIDGFYETISREDMFDPRTLLAYGLNGRTLSHEQGFPVRFIIPNHYGMKQPKWVTHIEASSEPGHGYWVDRGWSKEARPQTVSVIDTVATQAAKDGKIPVGGIAWAGDRGIRRVELQIDNGPWTEVTLLKPQLGPLTWILWRYDWPSKPGHHVFRVKATDGTGAVQNPEPNPPHPNGATGFHQVEVDI